LDELRDIENVEAILTEVDRKDAGHIVDEDSVLIERIRHGDRRALGELFERHVVGVRRLLVSVIGPGMDLDDLVQEIFIQVQRSISNFREQAKFSTWLHRVAVRQAYNCLRRRAREMPVFAPSVANEEIESYQENPYDKLVTAEMVEHFYAVLDTVGPRRRVAFLLFSIEGYLISEVAEILNISPMAAKSRIWFARREIIKKARRDPCLAPLVREL
jgi:RNA polymerase sigma-70 factor, ECF subfamily